MTVEDVEDMVKHVWSDKDTRLFTAKTIDEAPDEDRAEVQEAICHGCIYFIDLSGFIRIYLIEVSSPSPYH
jgi:hypothetical protein